jgi:hypothetical protein
MPPLLRLYVDPIPFVPLQGGLDSVVTSRDITDPHWQGGIEWTSNCVDAAAVTALECDDTPEVVWTDTPTGYGDQVTRSTFTVYHNYQCSTGGRTLEEHTARAIEALTRGETRTIEAVVERGGPTPDGTLGPLSASSLAGQAIVLDGGPATIVPALAGLEQALGWAYGGQGVIHLSRALAIAAAEASLLTFTQGRYRTALGTPVAVGSGYLGGPGGPAGATQTAYATGPLIMYRTAAELIGRPEESVIRNVNTVSMTVQRTVAVGWDCDAFAVPVTFDVPSLPPEVPES